MSILADDTASAWLEDPEDETDDWVDDDDDDDDDDEEVDFSGETE
jgi:hypothetical protein